MTITQINDLRAQRAAKINEQRKINDKAYADSKRAFTADEQTSYDKLGTEEKALKAQIDREEALNASEAETRGTQGRAERSDLGGGGGGGGSEEEEDDDTPEPDITLRADQEEVHTIAALRALMRGGSAEAFNAQQRAAFTKLRSGPRGKKEYREAYARFLMGGDKALEATERRTMQADTDTGGGYMLAPAQMVAEIIKALDNEVLVRKYAKKFTSGHKGLGAVSIDTDLTDSNWTVELAIGSEDELVLGKREMVPHPLAKLLKLSKTLARQSPAIVSLVSERLAYIFGITQEKAYLTGSGASQPLGIFTASDDGVPTSRDVSTGNTTTAIGADNLRAVKYSLKAGHRKSARWIFHRDALSALSRLKDGNGQYLWQPGLTAGDPDRLVNLPVDESEYAPNTFTTGLYVGALCNWDYYWIVDALDLTIQVLIELYAATNQNGYHARYEGDGMPVLSEAFARVKLA